MRDQHFESYIKLRRNHCMGFALRKRLKWCKRRADLYLQPYDNYQVVKIGILKALARVRLARAHVSDPYE